MPTIPVQRAGVPSSSVVRTTDGDVFTLGNGEVGYIQNLSTVALAVKMGTGASPTNLNHLLRGGTGASDGIGASLVIDYYLGVVSVAAMSGSPSFIAWKQAM
jgi:hypothetical protein